MIHILLVSLARALFTGLLLIITTASSITFAGCPEYLALGRPISGRLFQIAQDNQTSLVNLVPKGRGALPIGLWNGDVLEVTYKRGPTIKAVIRVEEHVIGRGQELRLVYLPMRVGSYTLEVLLNDELVRKIKSITLLGRVPEEEKPSPAALAKRKSAYILR